MMKVEGARPLGASGREWGQSTMMSLLRLGTWNVLISILVT